MYIYIYIYIYVCVCVCECVYCHHCINFLSLGHQCEVDVDACADNPCADFTGATCMDHTPSEVALHGYDFTCMNCPLGYELDGGYGPCLG